MLVNIVVALICTAVILLFSLSLSSQNLPFFKVLSSIVFFLSHTDRLYGFLTSLCHKVFVASTYIDE